MADDLSREAVAGVARASRCRHPARLPGSIISRKPPGSQVDGAWGIKDYDVFYFDDRDLSWNAGDAVIQRVNAVADDLGIRVETRNQARVHLWYERRFGGHYPQLASARDGIDRYLVACTCVGIKVASGELYAPNCLQKLKAGVLRINPLNPRPDLFRQKAGDYRARWPWLSIAG